MTEETKQLFEAPWYSDLKEDYVIDAKGFVLAKCLSNPITNCISHLPELYDALMEAAAGKCWSCAGENTETMLDHPCPKGHDEDCYVAKWRELLRKVRDGK